MTHPGPYPYPTLPARVAPGTLVQVRDRDGDALPLAWRMNLPATRPHNRPGRPTHALTVEPEHSSLLERLAPWSNELHDGLESIDRDPSWYGGTLETLRTVAREGWAEGANRVRATAKSVAEADLASLEVSTARRRRTRGPVGGNLDFDRWRRGDVDRAWETFTRPPTASPVVTILCPIGGSAGTKTAALQWTALPALVLADLLTSRGYSVRIVGVSNVTCESTSQNLIVSQVVKRATDPLDLRALAAVLTHPVMFRGAILCGWRVSGPRETDPGYSLGATEALPPADWAGWPLTGAVDGTPIVARHVYDREAAIEEVKRLVTSYSRGGRR